MPVCARFGCDADGLNAKWQAAKDAGSMVKFGGGFYCALVEDVYVFNGFFMTMRSGFVKPGVSIHYYVVEFEAKDLSWADFRGGVLGLEPIIEPNPPMSFRSAGFRI